MLHVLFPRLFSCFSNKNDVNENDANEKRDTLTQKMGVMAFFPKN